MKFSASDEKASECTDYLKFCYELLEVAFNLLLVLASQTTVLYGCYIGGIIV
jgi:hypothetical protein